MAQPDHEPFDHGLQSESTITERRTKQEPMVSMALMSQSAQEPTMIDLVSDEDSWDDWSNGADEDDRAAHERTALVEKDNSCSEDEGDIDSGEIARGNIVTSDHDDSISVESDTRDSEASLPHSIRALLDEWFVAKKNRRPPPCAVGKQTKLSLHSAASSSAAVTYMHRSGEVLQVAMYTLPECMMFPKRYIVIAQGPTKGPFAFAYVRGKAAGNQKIGVPYYIWEGLSAHDANGWEQTPSITKQFVAQTSAAPFKSAAGNRGSSLWTRKKHKEKTKAALHSLQRELVQPSHRKSNLASSDEPGYQDTIDGSALPVQIMNRVQAWQLEKGSKSPLPFITAYGPDHLKIAKGGRPAHFIYKDGSPLSVKAHTLKIANRQVYVITAKGPHLERSVISSTRGWECEDSIRICTFYRVWIGVAGDRDGFAEDTPVAKCFRAGYIPEAFRSKATAPNSSHKRTPAAVHPALLPSKRGRTNSSPLYQDLHHRKINNTQELDTHLLNNAVMLFYPKHERAPRVRLLGACDKVEKLFAQAIAGEVFEQVSGKVNVLSIRLPSLQRSINVVENDEEDFDGLMEAVKMLPCWSLQAGEMSGSCTVEIRART